METALFLELAQMGVKGLLAWAQFQSELYAKQQQRAAEGKKLTMEDVRPMLDDLNTTLAQNGITLQMAQLAYEAS